MRRLDRWIGLPLCCLAGLIWRLSQRLCWRHPPAAATRSGRVLYVALAEMGSIVLAAPAIRQNSHRHGTLPLFVTLTQTRAVFDFLGAELAHAGDIHVLRTNSIATLCADLWSFAVAARRAGVSVAIDLDPGARFSALVALLSGAPRRAGFAGPGQPYRGSLYTHPVACPAGRHMSENFAALLRAPFVGISSAATSVVTLPLPASARPPATAPGDILERLRRRILQDDPQRRRIVLIHANCSDPVPQRRWPAPRYIDLCRRLHSAWPDLLVLFIGAAAEEQAAAALCADIDDPRCVSVAGDFAVGELPALFALATLLVSSDCGAAHFAAHAGLPVIALFGPETPQRYRPLGATVALYAGLTCSPCLSAHNQRTSRCRDARCMQAIGVATVLAAIGDTLAATAQAATA